MPELSLDDYALLILTVPFLGWYLYKCRLLVNLAQHGIVTEGQSLKRVLNITAYRYKLNNGSTRIGKAVGSWKKGGALPVGITFDVRYLPDRPKFSCPAHLIEETIKRTRKEIFWAVVFAVLSLLPILGRMLQ